MFVVHLRSRTKEPSPSPPQVEPRVCTTSLAVLLELLCWKRRAGKASCLTDKIHALIARQHEIFPARFDACHQDFLLFAFSRISSKNLCSSGDTSFFVCAFKSLCIPLQMGHLSPRGTNVRSTLTHLPRMDQGSLVGSPDVDSNSTSLFLGRARRSRDRLIESRLHQHRCRAGFPPPHYHPHWLAPPHG